MCVVLSSFQVKWTSNDSYKTVLQKLMKFCGPIEDPSTVTYARRISKSGHLEDLLSYQSTVGLITSSKYGFLHFETDPYLLALVQVIL
jgi:hypothetical protein